MPLVTFFSVLELPEKNRKEQPPLVRRGLSHFVWNTSVTMDMFQRIKIYSKLLRFYA